MRPTTLLEANKILQEKGLKLLKQPKSFRNVWDILDVECPEKHRSRMSLNDIKWAKKKHSACPTCNTEIKNEVLSLGWMSELNFHSERIKMDIEGEIPRFFKPTTKFHARCRLCGSPRKKLQYLKLFKIAKVGCERCYKAKVGIELATPEDKIAKLATKMQVVMLDSYSQSIRVNTKLNWCCKHCLYIFERSINGFSTSPWCPKCESNPNAKKYYTGRIKSPVLLHELYRHYAEQRSGALLSKTYNGISGPLSWRCKAGHIFQLRPVDFQRGAWCGICTGSARLGEEVVRCTLEQMFNVKFSKAHPTWLRGENSNRLQLDGYNEELKIAFEHQGDQHFRSGSIFVPSKAKLRSLMQRDETKRKICKARGITLIEVLDVPKVTKIENVPNVIIKSLPKKLRERIVTTDIDFNKIYDRDRAKVIKEIVKSRLGKVIKLPKLMYSEAKILVKCNNKNHSPFTPTISSLEMGSWCKSCAQNIIANTKVRKNFDRIEKVLIENKCTIIKEKRVFAGKNSFIKFTCRNGHKNSRTALYLQRLKGTGNPCSVCVQKLTQEFAIQERSKQLANMDLKIVSVRNPFTDLAKINCLVCGYSERVKFKTIDRRISRSIAKFGFAVACLSCSGGTELSRRGIKYNFYEQRTFARSLEIATAADWRELVQIPGFLPPGILRAPDAHFRRNGWRGWRNFLGN